jgi:hypothetical protein
MFLLIIAVVIIQANAENSRKGPRAPALPRPRDVELGEVRALSGGLCQVCGAPMAGEIVRCELCRTPHHAECWSYMGRCSTYACKGRRAAA